MRRTLALLALLAPATLAAACSAPNGGLFAAEGGASGTGGGATGSSSGSGTGGTTGASSSGATSSGHTSSGGTSTSGMTSSSSGQTSTSSSGHTSSSSTSSSGGPTGACTDAADESIVVSLGQQGLTDAVTQCAQDNFLGEPATSNCIQQQTGLSSACVACFDANVHCGAQHCFQQCSQGGNTTCNSCLHMYCTPAFNTCSGLMGP
jgi:hypothetical protein